MAGLNAGTVSSSAWPLLRDGLDAAVAVDDAASERARVVLAARDIMIGACGSATLAGLSAASSQPSLAEVRDVLGLTEASTVVLVATDAPPDPAPPQPHRGSVTNEGAAP
jgi:diaminopropionate ammonia-lyase